ncbi:hypothetical protein OIE62_07675 [Streptomyces scopuliridis]|uniref:Uncharacterized protein n=1 Tax=Streptomyces scopuliridis TaxID=452529 RepID=A0ACD4ZTK6_9ACTN|nr:hypothetical protein [Streptomyces scopuliridis]WSC01555.1 hypothetical protein OG835_34145 [Streptomyces scopuliridis]WSC04907.1 hypothetical protein OIE62_07675 [Streptomyces scopuliridis]
MKQKEPHSTVLEYITIIKDPRTQLVIALGSGPQAAGILQTTGHSVPAPGPRGKYHRQPHTLPVQQQRQGATTAAHALLLAGFSVHLDPTLNTLAFPDTDRAATHRYLTRLTEQSSAATSERDVERSWPRS